jgi:diguanylate cyclase (GGDEF)-like protein/PAS domain S-box-containing protein
MSGDGSSGTRAIRGLLRRLFERAPDGMIVTRVRDSHVLLANEAFSRLLGVPVDEIVGHSSEEFGLWREPAQGLNALRGLGAEALRLPVETQLLTGDGTTRDIEITLELMDIQGEPHAFGITRDISERKASERSLRTSEERFRTLVQSSRDAILVTDGSGRLTYVSPGIEHLLGYEPEALIGTDERKLIHPHDVRIRDNVVERLKTQGTPQPPAELRMRQADGEWRWIETIDTNRLGDPVVLGIVTNARDITDRRAMDETLAFGALHDPLTGLPNRRLLDDRIDVALARAGRTGALVALLFCDLDRFKEVNDRYGHEAGDEVLRQIASRLRLALRPSDSLARLGGDEFVVVCSDLRSIAEAATIAQRVMAGVDAPVETSVGPVQMTVSIGIAGVAGEDAAGAEAGALLRNADAAMYRAKNRGGNRWELFDAAMQERASHRLELESHLQEALQRREFVLVYQPIVRLDDGSIAGVEALLRWQHPTLGLVPPAYFLEAAESSGLIVPIGDWVLTNATRQILEWRQTEPDLFVCVNVSGRQLNDPGLRQFLVEHSRTGDLADGCLRLELTESVLIDYTAAVESDLARAVELGIRIGIDDFGTGFASLTYLQQFPISFLKIDRSFVTELREENPPAEPSHRPALVAMILEICRALRLEAVAEGVEREEEAAALVAMGCVYGQGFLYARPLTVEAVTEYLGNRRNVNAVAARTARSGKGKAGTVRAVRGRGPRSSEPREAAGQGSRSGTRP